MCVSTWEYIEGICFPAHGSQENYASRPYHLTFKGWVRMCRRLGFMRSMLKKTFSIYRVGMLSFFYAFFHHFLIPFFFHGKKWKVINGFYWRMAFALWSKRMLEGRKNFLDFFNACSQVFLYYILIFVEIYKKKLQIIYVFLGLTLFFHPFNFWLYEMITWILS